jgi:hypothetical protein
MRHKPTPITEALGKKLEGQETGRNVKEEGLEASFEGRKIGTEVRTGGIESIMAKSRRELIPEFRCANRKGTRMENRITKGDRKKAL